MLRGGIRCVAALWWPTTSERWGVGIMLDHIPGKGEVRDINRPESHLALRHKSHRQGLQAPQA